MSELKKLASRLMTLDDKLIFCMKCGNCQAVCPMFGATHMEADVARGKLALIGNLAHEVIRDPEAVADKLGRCLLCGSCQANCPSGVRIMDIFMEARELVYAYLGLNPVKKMIFRILLAKPDLFNFTMGMIRTIPRLQHLVCPVDRVIGLDEDTVELCGAELKVVRTPGHSPDHVCFITPDNVCFAGDTLMTEDVLAEAMVPFAFDLADDLKSKQVVGELDCDTLLLLFGLFIVIAGIHAAGVIDAAARLFHAVAGESPFRLFTLLVVVSVVLSAFIDNIPYVAAMLPVVQSIAALMNDGRGMEPYVFYFGLLTGATLGGNLIPIGASANIAAIGILRKNGETVTTRDFLRIGVPFTLAAVLAGYAYLWLVWGKA